MSLTQARLRRLLLYNPGTGVFIWLVKTAQRNEIGDVAGGSMGKERYIRINVGGVKYLAHRLAFLYMTGRWPLNEIDHKDLDRANNRWSNLREATRGQNATNKGEYRNNTSGYRGVYWYPKYGNWLAKITVKGVQKHLGYFTNPEEAYAAYLAAKGTVAY